MLRRNEEDEADRWRGPVHAIAEQMLPLRIERMALNAIPLIRGTDDYVPSRNIERNTADSQQNEECVPRTVANPRTGISD